MATSKFTVDCPSCEAAVPIKGPAMIGKKTECPTCKYRFVVPEPADAADVTDDAPAEPAKEKGSKAGKKTGKKAKPKAEKKGGNTKLLVGAGVGVLALVALVVAGIFLLGGDDTPAPASTPPRSVAQNTPPAPAPATEPAAGATPTAGDTPAAGATPPADAGAKPDEAKPPPAPSGPGKEASNLLPGDTTAVYRIYYDRLTQNATPLANAALDAKVRDLVRSSLTFGSDQLATSIHCIVGPDRDAFVVLRTKAKIAVNVLLAEMKLEKEPKVVRGNRAYFVIESNPLVDALAKTFTTQSLAKAAGVTWPAPPPKVAEEAAKKKYALAIDPDAMTVFIGTQPIVERFLTDLESNGFPPYKSELSAEEPPAVPAAGGEGGRSGGPPGGSGGSGGPPGGSGGGPPGGSGRPPGPAPMSAAAPFQQGRRPGLAPVGGSGGPGAPEGTGAPAGQGPPRKLYTSNPTYRTIDPALKRLLNQLEDNDKHPPAVVYAEILSQQVVNGRQLADIYKLTGNALVGALSRIKLAGGTLSQFSRDKFIATVALEFINEDDAKKTVEEFVSPQVAKLFPQLDLILGTKTTVNSGGTSGGGGPNDGPLGASSSGGGYPGSSGDPRRPGGGSGSGSGGGYPGSSGDPRRPGGGSGSGDLPPGGDLSGVQAANAGAVNIAVSDRVMTMDIELNWPEDKYNSLVQPLVSRVAGQFKGRMSVLTGEVEWHRLAAVVGKATGGGKPFPAGTLARDSAETRYSLPYPPEQRTSFFVDLLPFLGQGALRAQVQDKKFPWYAKENLPAAETWVTELLVPYYPQDTWRATHPLAPGHSLGGTNYVGLAGLGLEAGRYDPANPDHAKKVGVVGYNWGSKPEEITDGLSNTIYLAQVAPGGGRPWIAGGGATVVGVDEGVDPMAPFVHRLPDGRRGAYMLMADNSVRFFKEGTDPKLFQALVTRAGGESLTDLDKAGPKVAPTKPLETEIKGSAIAVAAPAGKVDEAELKKLQGTWRVTYLKGKLAGQKVGPEVLDKIGLEMTIDGRQIRMKVTALGKTESASAEIVHLDPKASPKQFDIRVENPMTKESKVDLAVYEFVGDNKIKMRSAAEKSTKRPEKVAIPDDKSDAEYQELERVL